MTLRALIVEDNHSTALVAEFILKEFDISCQYLEHSAETMNLLEQTHFDVLLLDWMMPELDGLELLKAIRADERFAQIKVIMCTSRSNIEDRQTALRAGADIFLLKPLTRQAVHSALHDLGLL